MPTEFVAVNLPRQLLERLDICVQQVNETGHIYNSSRAEAVKRSVERYIEYLDDLLRRYGKTPEPPAPNGNNNLKKNSNNNKA